MTRDSRTVREGRSASAQAILQAKAQDAHSYKTSPSERDARDARHWFVPFGKRVRTGVVKDTCGGNSALLHKKGSQMGWIKRKKVEKQNDRP